MGRLLFGIVEAVVGVSLGLLAFIFTQLMKVRKEARRASDSRTYTQKLLGSGWEVIDERIPLRGDTWIEEGMDGSGIWNAQSLELHRYPWPESPRLIVRYRQRQTEGPQAPAGGKE